jgi:hypothetical protein
MKRVCQSALAVFAILAVWIIALPASSAWAQSGEVPEEIRFDADDRVIEVSVNGLPLRFEVEPSLAGPPIINPEIVEKLGIWSQSGRTIDFGGYILPGDQSKATLDFGFGPVQSRVAWSTLKASTRVDGVIGVHDLPHRRVTFDLRVPVPGETVQVFKLKRRGSRNYSRLGTQIKVEKEKLFLIFSLRQAPNVITAPTANFLATHQDGGFVPDSDGFVDMVFGVRRPVRAMQIAFPIELGPLAIDRFAVRVEDHGRPTKVGDIAQDDARFTDSGNILVSRRKRQGRPDLLTLLGTDQLKACSRLSFDLKKKLVELSCASEPPGQD